MQLVLRVVNVLLVPAAVLMACYTPYATDEESPFVIIRPGSSLVLHQPLTIPRGHWSLYFQGGKAMSFGRVDEYLPFCELLLARRQENALALQPDTFVIYRVRNDIDIRAFLDRTPVLRVTHNQTLADYVPVLYQTELYLRSEEQPEVRLLRCGRLEEAGVGPYLSATEIREALGNYLSLQLAVAE